MRPVSWTIMAAVLGLALMPCPTLAGDEPPLPDSRLGYKTAPILLLTRSDVLADLGMTTEQSGEAQKTATALWLRADALKARPAADQPVDNNLRRARAEVFREMNGWIDAKLSPEQKTRLMQIDLQWEGPSAVVSRRAIVETLRLNGEQKRAIETAVRERDVARAAGHDSEATLAETTLRILSPEQSSVWKELLGRPFSLQLPPLPAEKQAAR